MSELEANQHVWESIITRVNCQVQRMRDLGVFHSSIALGPIVLRRHYGIEGPTDSGEIVQAGISSDSGLVAVFWDTEDLYEAHKADTGSMELDAAERSRPLAECGAAIRWLVAKHANTLARSLFKAATVVR